MWVRVVVSSGSKCVVTNVKVATLIYVNKCYGDGCHCQIGDISSVHMV